LIYLVPQLQEKVLGVFHFALRLNGFLFLGSSEGLGRLAADYSTVDSAAKLYRKERDMKVHVEVGMDVRRTTMPAAAPSPASRPSVTLDRQLLHDYDFLLRQHVPGGILVNEEKQLLHCFGDVSLVLRHPEGRFENELFGMVRDEIRMPLSAAFHRAVKTGTRITTRNAVPPLHGGGKYDLIIDPIPDPRSDGAHYFISVQVPEGERVPTAQARESQFVGPQDIPEQLHQRIIDLEHELQVTKESLQTTVEELQTANEELQATNEELLAANEELQSTNEELHSVNEELYTVNSEFELKNKELVQLYQDHENLLRSTEVGTVYLDRDLRIRKFNPAIERFFHLLPQDVGRPLEHIAYQLANQEQMLEDVHRVLATGTQVEREVSTSEGHWLLKRVLPFRTETDTIGGVVITFTDVTQLKEAEQTVLQLNRDLEKKVEERTGELRDEMAVRLAAEEALNRSLEKYRVLFESFPLAITISDAQGKVIEANPMAERLSAVVKGEVPQPGSSSARVFRPDGAPLHPHDFPSVKALRENRVIEDVEMGVEQEDGSIVWLNVTAHPIPLPQLGVATTYADVTGRKAMTLELREAKEAAEQANAAKGIFLANMSHEIRTPMSGVLGMMELLQTTSLSDEQRHYLETLGTAARNLLAVINDILDFSKIDAGALTISNEPFIVSDVVEDVANMHYPLAAAKQLTLELDIQPAAAGKVAGDALRLKQVLGNLVSNAIKFTDYGKVSVGVRREPAGPGRAVLHFVVSDTGIGVAPEAAATVFKPFIQADSSTTRKFGGTGLGLAICDQLVSMMGGRIWHVPRPQGGSEFHFTLTVGTAGEGAEVPPPSAGEPSAAGSDPKLKILIAEDDPITRDLLVRITRKMGHAPLAVENGREAVQAAVNQPFDLVLMDVSMPEMDGVAAMKRIRELNRLTERLPIVAITAHAFPETREQLMSAGMTGVITKPFTLQALRSLVKEQFGGTADASSA
ncbi:MAG TPA: ATP-binding protein, partial [Verrucomicrobiae bacterium]|nr:ATP-binding protein [Verrucomicrobiae bacterium]